MLIICCCRKFLIALLLVGLFCFSVSAASLSSHDKKLAEVIKEAGDYSMVKPKHSLKVLEDNRALLAQASEHYQYYYYRAAFWAAVSLHDAEKVSYFVDMILKVSNFSKSEQFFSATMNSLSLWYRVNQNYRSSILASHCSVKFAKTEQDLNNSMIPLGLAHLMMANYTKAHNIFDLNLELSQKLQDTSGISTAHNNLGVLHVFTQEYEVAEQHFRDALKLNEQMARVNGTTANLANLLLVFYLQQDWQSFYRLVHRANRASESLNHEDLKHYLFWIESAFKIKAEGNKQVNIELLVQRYQMVKEPSVIKFIALIAEDLKIALPESSQPIINSKLNFAKAFPTCSANPTAATMNMLKAKLDSIQNAEQLGEN